MTKFFCYNFPLFRLFKASRIVYTAFELSSCRL
nr:MAG TPA: hypothetical protein [Caudoviricetes sp.]